MVQYICGGTLCVVELPLACIFVWAFPYLLHLPSPLFLLFSLTFTLICLPPSHVFLLIPLLLIFSPLSFYLNTPSFLPCPSSLSLPLCVQIPTDAPLSPPLSHLV